MAATKEKSPEICPECGSEDTYHFDPFGMGGLLDDHMDTTVSEDELSKRLNEAAEMARKLGGIVPAGIESELAELSKSKLTWQDFIRNVSLKKRENENRNNWLLPKRKLLSAGLFIPQKYNYSIKFLLAYDCSGSMTKEDITYGISQVQALEDKAEGYCLPWDGEPYFDAMVKIKNANPDNLRNAKYKGGGGTALCPVFKRYEKEVGSVDIIIIVSDFYICDETELQKLTPPKNTEVVWLSVSGNSKFKPPFGRIFNLTKD